MRLRGSRPLLLAALAGVLTAAGAAQAYSGPNRLTAPAGLAASVGDRSVKLSWQPASFPPGSTDARVLIGRDGVLIASLPPGATAYSDAAVAPGQTHRYTVAETARRGGLQLSSPPSAPVALTLPAYLVGAATADITPSGVVNLGGYGFGDGSVLPAAVIGRGGQAGPSTSRIRARAMVVDDGHQAVAIASIETQGMFAAYQNGPYGLLDMAARVARDTGGALPADHIVISSAHSHHGPDTIGVWGGVPRSYLQYVADQTVKAIEQAFAGRRFAVLRAGESDASDLIYNQACTEALNQNPQPTYTGPPVCPTPGKDGMVRVVQATAPDGQVIVTQMVFAAHATTNIGTPIDGDWPQFLGDDMAATFGGVGIGMEGAVGGTQPCRPSCSFTSHSNPGYGVADRRTAILLNYMAHVKDALAHSSAVTGPVGASRLFVREPLDGPVAAALFAGGSDLGAPIMRSHDSPWVTGQTLRTVASAVRVGDLLYAGIPGEGYPAIGFGAADAVTGARMVIPLSLADDQVGYLIAPASYAPAIYAELPVNDNGLFNVSPTIGDHVMCADITLALGLGFAGSPPPGCAGYDALDAQGDPVGQLPVGGVVAPALP